MHSKVVQGFTLSLKTAGHLPESVLANAKTAAWCLKTLMIPEFIGGNAEFAAHFSNTLVRAEDMRSNIFFTRITFVYISVLETPNYSIHIFTKKEFVKSVVELCTSHRVPSNIFLHKPVLQNVMSITRFSPTKIMNISVVAWCSLLIVNKSVSWHAEHDMRIIESNPILWLTSLA